MVRLAPSIAVGVLCVATGLSLGGCAASHPPTTYDLIAPRAFAGSTHPANWQLIVDQPSALQALNTNRIMVRPAPGQIAYYKGAAWGDRLPSLLQARIIETFQNTGAVRSVSSSADMVTGDYTLDSEIRAFQVDINRPSVAANVDLFVKLVNSRTGRVVASRDFSARIPAPNDSTQAGVNALNQALTEVLQDTANWVSSFRYYHHHRTSKPRRTRPVAPSSSS